MSFSNSLTQQLGIQYPVIQGPFGGGLSSIDLLAAVSNAGGLGSFGSHHLSPAEIKTLVSDIRQKTDKPFNINLWVSNFDKDGQSLDQQRFEKYSAIFKSYYDELGLNLPEPPEQLYHNFEEQAEAVIEASPKVFSFVYGIPSADIIEKCKSRGITVVGTATTLEEAIALANSGVDAIVATGFEAGGHRVSFLKEPEDSLTGTLALIPQVVDQVKVPVIAAGGISDARGVKAAFALGAEGVQIGTAFLACQESGTSQKHRDLLFTTAVRNTVLSRAYTGRLARFVDNKFIQSVSQQQDLPAPFPIQSFFVKALKQEALKTSNNDYTSLYAGQGAGLLQHKKAKDLFQELIKAFESH